MQCGYRAASPRQRRCWRHHPRRSAHRPGCCVLLRTLRRHGCRISARRALFQRLRATRGRHATLCGTRARCPCGQSLSRHSHRCSLTGLKARQLGVALPPYVPAPKQHIASDFRTTFFLFQFRSAAIQRPFWRPAARTTRRCALGLRLSWAAYSAPRSLLSLAATHRACERSHIYSHSHSLHGFGSQR